MKEQNQALLLSIRLSFEPSPVQSGASLVDGRGTTLNDSHTAYEDTFREAFRSATRGDSMVKGRKTYQLERQPRAR